MKNELRQNVGATSRLTIQILQKLRDEGFKYVQVKGFSPDRRLDYMAPSYLLLIPIKDIPEDIAKKDIYEPINSEILTDWAQFPTEGIEVLIGSHR